MGLDGEAKIGLDAERDAGAKVGLDALSVLLLAARRGLLQALDEDLGRGVPAHCIRAGKGDGSCSKKEVTHTDLGDHTLTCAWPTVSLTFAEA